MKIFELLRETRSQATVDRALNMIAQGMSSREISAALGMTLDSYQNWMTRLIQAGRAPRRLRKGETLASAALPQAIEQAFRDHGTQLTLAQMAKIVDPLGNINHNVISKKMSQVKKQMNIKIYPNQELDKALMDVYQPGLPDQQLLDAMHAQGFGEMTLDQLHRCLARLPYKYKFIIKRNHPPAPWQGVRPATYSDLDNIPRKSSRFYDPVFTQHVNEIIELARNGYGDDEIADSVDLSEVPGYNKKETTIGAVRSTLYQVKNYFGIDIPPGAGRHGRTRAGFTKHGMVLIAIAHGRSLDHIANELKISKKYIHVVLSKHLKTIYDEYANKHNITRNQLTDTVKQQLRNHALEKIRQEYSPPGF